MKAMHLQLHRLLLVSFLLGLVALFVAVIGSGAPASAAPPSGAITPTGTPRNTSTPIPTAWPCGEWRLSPSPNGTTQTNFLQSVAVISESDVWAVGWQDYPQQAGLILHWDGDDWSVVPSPAPVAYLHSVAAFASNDVWAVGFFDGFPARSLALHWDGTAWSVVSTPQVGAGQNFLYGVGGSSSTDVWAVGQASYKALALHWDGTAWTSVLTPDFEAATLKDVTALAPNDVWAVGRIGDYWPTTSLILHWDGNDWTQVDSPSPGARENDITSISAASANDIWAVGYWSPQIYNYEKLMLHWDGASWVEVPTPARDEYHEFYAAYLEDVVAVSPNEAWAVGRQDVDSSDSVAVALRWDGTAWTESDLPQYSSSKNRLFGVAAVAPGELWAVGTYWLQGPGYGTLTMRYGPECGAGTPGPSTNTPRPATNTPVPPTATRTVTGTPPTATNTPSPAPTVCGTLMNEGFESGTLGQFTNVVTQCAGSGCGWFASTADPRVGAHSAFAPNLGFVSDQRMQLTSPVSPVAGTMFSFWHSYNMEANFDGGVLEGSTNGGVTWFDMGQYMLSGGYNGTISTLFENPLGGREAWTGNSEGYVETVINAAPFVGRSLLFRFREGSDNSLVSNGWYIDDILIAGSGSCTPPSATPTNIGGATNTPRPSRTSTQGPSATNTGTPIVPTATNTGTPATATNTPTVAPPVCGTFFSEQFEDGTLGQLTNIVTQCAAGPCGWIASTADPYSGSYSAFAPDLNNITDQRLQLTEPVLIPGEASLIFRHRYDTEATFDGGVLEGSTNGGASWFDMGEDIVTNGYNDSISTLFSNPLAGREAWTGNSEGYVQTEVDLSDYAGLELLFRFREGNDNSVGSIGWYVDDVMLVGSVSCPTSTPTNTPEPGTTNTPEPSATPTPEPTAMACSMLFSDVQPGDTFYNSIMCMACQGLISGYPDGTFRPNNHVTRGQLAKLVSNAAGFNEAVIPAEQVFTDISADSPFFMYVQRVASRTIIGGYACGGPGEPCDANNRPYFRPGANATRGQISKIISSAAKMRDYPTVQTFADVPPDHTFFVGVERLAMHNIMSGYACGGPGEPCDANNRPYFRPSSNATRGQASKLLSNTFSPNCRVAR